MERPNRRLAPLQGIWETFTFLSVTCHVDLDLFSDPNEDMDISPGSTPTSLRSSNCAVTPLVPNSTPGSYNLNALTTTGSLPSASDLNISSIPGLINQLSGGKNNQELTNKGKLFLLHCCFTSTVNI